MKKHVIFILVFSLLFALTGCGQTTTGEEILLRQECSLENITQSDLTNAHNGQTTTITEEAAISEITAFLNEVIGKADGNGKGYYEGSYTLTLTYQDGSTGSLGFGDSDCLYMGEGEDGYPIRYLLCGKTVSENVIPFFSQFDQSGFSWT